MPFMPHVPHIVGDDEDGEELTQTSNITAPSLEHGREIPESELSDLSESSAYDDASETDEDDSNNSTAEEEDWSNNISYIVRTPAREAESTTEWVSPKIKSNASPKIEYNASPKIEYNASPKIQYNASPKIEYNASAAEYPDIDLTDEQSADDEQQTDSTQDLKNEEVERQDLAMETCDKNKRNAEPESSAESSLSYSPVGPDRIINEGLPSSSDSTQGDNEEYEDMQKSKPAAKKSIINTPLELSRRLSLRSAYRSEPTKSVTPPKKSVSRGRPRQEESNNDQSTPITIGARVVKRTRRSTAKNATLNLKKSPLKLAKPVEVTEYFTKISATLVRNRVNLIPFLYIRNRIDHLVGEAIAKTKIQVENGPKSPL